MGVVCKLRGCQSGVFKWGGCRKDCFKKGVVYFGSYNLRGLLKLRDVYGAYIRLLIATHMYSHNTWPIHMARKDIWPSPACGTFMKIYVCTHMAIGADAPETIC